MVLMTAADTAWVRTVSPKVLVAQGRGARNAACVYCFRACWMTAAVSWHNVRWPDDVFGTIFTSVSLEASPPVRSLVRSAWADSTIRGHANQIAKVERVDPRCMVVCMSDVGLLNPFQAIDTKNTLQRHVGG